MSSSRSKKKTVIFNIVISFILCLILLFLFFNNVCKPRRYYNTVCEACERFEIEESLILAIIKVESNFNSRAVSDKEACGLMQIKRSTFDYVCGVYKLEYSAEEIFGVKENIYVGTAYIDYLFKKFLNIQEVLAAYNAGEGTVREWLKNDKYSDDGITVKIFPYMETRNYVNKVLFYKNYYDRII